VTEGANEVSAGELTERVMRVAHLIRRASMAGLAPLNLTPAQSRALRTISRAESPIRMGELAAALGVVPRSATDLVDALQGAGLVERLVDPANRPRFWSSSRERAGTFSRQWPTPAPRPPPRCSAPWIRRSGHCWPSCSGGWVRNRPAMAPTEEPGTDIPQR